MTFVVVGGGPTGVELAGAIAELAHFVLARDFATSIPKRPKYCCWKAVRRYCRVSRPIFQRARIGNWPNSSQSPNRRQGHRH